MTAFGLSPDRIEVSFLAATWGVPLELVERAVASLEAEYGDGGVHRSEVESVRGVMLDVLRRTGGGAR